MRKWGWKRWKKWIWPFLSWVSCLCVQFSFDLEEFPFDGWWLSFVEHPLSVKCRFDQAGGSCRASTERTGLSSLLCCDLVTSEATKLQEKPYPCFKEFLLSCAYYRAAGKRDGDYRHPSFNKIPVEEYQEGLIGTTGEIGKYKPLGNFKSNWEAVKTHRNI